MSETLITLLNIVHLFAVGILTTGWAWLPSMYLPVYIVMIIIGLVRYHDFCWMSRAVEIIRGFGEDCGLKKTNFFNDVHEMFPGMIPPMTKKMRMNFFIGGLGMACFFSFIRLMKKHKIRFIPNDYVWFLSVLCLTPWILVEAYVFFIDTPQSKINLEDIDLKENVKIPLFTYIDEPIVLIGA